VAFFTLFSWAGALYMNQGLTVVRSLSYALIWGLVAMFIVSYFFHFLQRMTETGNQRIGTCVGNVGMVYLDIPAGGQGEIRMPCSGVMTHFKARVANGAAVRAGTPVRVTRVLGPNLIEVELDQQNTAGKAPSP
jgi:membrane protein implicated in regulation of membrane protease activity